MPAPFLDFHTHAQGCEKYTNRHDVVVVQSLHLGETPHPRADFVTQGIHPMLQGAKDFLDRYHKEGNALIDEWCHHINTSHTPVIGIGECGWDHRSPLTLKEQETLVDLHISVATQLRLPLIFHIVKSWHQLLAKRKSLPLPTTPWIVHGFRGNAILARQLINAGIHLSLHPKSPTPTAWPYLLETDDLPLPIDECYRQRFLAEEKQKREVINFFSTLFPLGSHLKKVDL